MIQITFQIVILIIIYLQVVHIRHKSINYTMQYIFDHIGGFIVLTIGMFWLCTSAYYHLNETQKPKGKKGKDKRD